MRILFITGGLAATLRGKSNSYQEALMDEFQKKGHSIGCLCMAETHSKPFLQFKKTFENFPIYHLMNSGIYPGVYPQGGVGTRTPQRDIESTATLEESVLNVLEEFNPDLISFQSLFGFPLELLSKIKSKKIPTVFTALDYYSLCPTAHLFLPDQKPCRLTARELTCNTCCEKTPHYPIFWITHHWSRWIDSLKNPTLQTLLYKARNLLLHLNRTWNSFFPVSSAFQNRRRSAIQQLKQITVIHTLSNKQAQVMMSIAGPLLNIHPLHAHPSSTHKITNHLRKIPAHKKVRFIALNVHAPYKGSSLLLKSFHQIESEGFEFELHFHGARPEQISSSPQIFYHDRYTEAELDLIASQADFCLIPSLWDETLGFVGEEMMARGVPLIVSNLAGVSEFVVHQETGLIFDPHQPDELTQILRNVITNTSLRKHLQQQMIERDHGLKTFTQHADEIEKLFQKSIDSFCCESPQHCYSPDA